MRWMPGPQHDRRHGPYGLLSLLGKPHDDARGVTAGSSVTTWHDVHSPARRSSARDCVHASRCASAQDRAQPCTLFAAAATACDDAAAVSKGYPTPAQRLRFRCSPKCGQDTRAMPMSIRLGTALSVRRAACSNE